MLMAGLEEGEAMLWRTFLTGRSRAQGQSCSSISLSVFTYMFGVSSRAMGEQ